ncbi:hypothetical protein MRB53_021385 [Persea americana]|uniref:Uncharacterized protein n=1 Tax=Persea americana TaxID=3435 RepID=A0ACC2L4W1_PERAE|nr:hypothetical protein MRB53_021385 [Persea americana]
MNSSLLELAKLHFNNVQTTFQISLRSLSRWWKDLGLGEQYSSFARDRLVESFFWAAAVTSEPQFGRCQEAVTKAIQFISTIDDIYDVYGTVDELELFTNAADRWDLKAMEQLPEYMKTCFLALYNSINEIGYEILKEEGHNVIPYLRNAEELKRGDAPKSILCYMHEAGVPEEVARDHIMVIFRETWKKLNEYLVECSPLPPEFINYAMNVGRASYFTYKQGDGFGDPDSEQKKRYMSLFAEPLQVDEAKGI